MPRPFIMNKLLTPLVLRNVLHERKVRIRHSLKTRSPACCLLPASNAIICKCLASVLHHCSRAQPCLAG